MNKRSISGSLSILLAIFLQACVGKSALPICDSFKTLDKFERKAVVTAERELYRSGLVESLVLNCIRVEPAKRSLLVAFYPPVGNADDEVIGKAYGVQVSEDGAKVLAKNFDLPFAPWVENDEQE